MEDIKVGDYVIRYFGYDPNPGSHCPQMRMIVTQVTDNKIHCGPWKFDRKTGGELEKELGWTATKTGSYIKPEPVKFFH